MQVIRYDSDGEVDDVAIDCDLFRLEQLEEGRWWAAVYRGDKRVCFNIFKTGRGIGVIVEEDDFGCIDDTTIGGPNDC